MQLCRNCHVMMAGVMSFSKDRHEKFCRCPGCYGETRHQRIRDEETDFREVLHKEYQKKRSRSK